MNSLDSSRLLACPNRPYLLLRCRAHKIHVSADGGSSPYPKIAFTMDMYAVSGQLFSSCYAIFGDTHCIAGNRLYNWECSFVDDDRVAVAYRDSHFGRKTLNVFLYDISKRQFRTCCIFLDDMVSAFNEWKSFDFSIRDRTAEFYSFDDYTVKQDRLIIIVRPNGRDYRAVISYHLQWPKETSTTLLTPLWEPKIVSCDFIQLTAALFQSMIDDIVLLTYEVVSDENDLYLCVFDGGYDQFFRVDLSGKNVNLREPTWTYCDGVIPPHDVDTYFCNRTARVYLQGAYRNDIWFLEKDEEKFTWTRRRLHVPLEQKKYGWCWSARDTAFAVNEQGGVYDLDVEGEPRLCGYIMVSTEPPSLQLLAITRFFDSLGEKVGEEILRRSKKQLQDKGYPQWVANLALK